MCDVGGLGCGVGGIQIVECGLGWTFVRSLSNARICGEGFCRGGAPGATFRIATFCWYVGIDGESDAGNGMMCGQIFSAKDEEGSGAGNGKKTNQAKVLLARYGGAYLATSISLSIVSFSLCYLLVQAGVDVPSVLEKVRDGGSIQS